jgi:FkbM family methyltransferase
MNGHDAKYKIRRKMLAGGKWVRDRFIYSPIEREQKKFADEGGDTGIRIDYDALDEHSIVVDLGGYIGDFASDIFSKYLCTVYVFEPVKRFADVIRARFANNKKIHTYEYALAEKNETRAINLDDAASSFYRGTPNTEIKVREFGEVMNELGVKEIDLLKINIEGGEYELLPHLIHTGWIKKIKAFQVQFHEFYPDADKKMAEIHAELEKTHRMTWGFHYIWENWERE